MSVAQFALGQEQLANPEEVSQRQLVWRRFRRHKLAVVGLAIIVSLAFFAYIGPFLNPFDGNTIPTRQNAVENLRPMHYAPDGLHVLGTDSSGRDYLARLMQGGRVSLTLAILVTLCSQTIGMVVGSTSGFLGGWVDSVLMRFVDFLLTLPLLPLLLVFYVLIPPNNVPGGSMTVLFIVLVTFGWMGTARLVRGMVLSLKNQEFTDAARSMGASNWEIISHHMLPNSLAPVIVSATLGAGGVIITEAALSYLGFGVRPPDPSWGNLLHDVQGYMFTNPLLVFYPGICIFFTSLSFNFIGDALRDALDPRLKM